MADLIGPYSIRQYIFQQENRTPGSLQKSIKLAHARKSHTMFLSKVYKVGQCPRYKTDLIGPYSIRQYIFQQENPYLRLLRSAGLTAVNKTGFLKKNFIRHASGMHKI